MEKYKYELRTCTTTEWNANGPKTQKAVWHGNWSPAWVFAASLALAVAMPGGWPFPGRFAVALGVPLVCYRATLTRDDVIPVQPK
jgi:hypothetical protein